jgi:hypothetical protein
VNNPPTASAGPDQSITAPSSSIALVGSGSDSDGSVAQYQWSQVSGPNTATLSAAASDSTSVTGLIVGSYVFRLTVTDDGGLTASDTLTVTVDPAPVPPTANAGADQTVMFPTATAALAGTGSDSDGTVSRYQWSQVSGPNTATFSAGTSASTSVSGLIVGSYVFKLTVTDNDGLTGSDTVTVTVSQGGGNTAPRANAGADQTIKLPSTSATLSGSGTDTDGTITKYQWTQVSGPSTATFESPTQASTTVTGLTAGTYFFRLTVTDNTGSTGTDLVMISVKP